MASPDWDGLKDGLATLCASLLGISCQWRDQPQKLQQGAWATLDALAPSSLGVDDTRWADVGSPATGVRATVVGQRELTLQVTAWSPRQTPSLSARALLEQLRTRMRWPSTLETLRQLGVALVRIEDVADVDPPQDGRRMSQATLDVRVAYAASETDVEIPYIEDAHLSSTFANAAGDQLGAAVQMNINPTDPTP